MMQSRGMQGLLAGSGVGILLIILWLGGLFHTIQLASLNPYYIPQPTSDNVIIVAIDEATLDAYGRSTADWSRTIFADFVERMDNAAVRVVAFHLLFADPGTDDPAFQQALKTARTGDNRLRIVAGAVGVQAPVLPLPESIYPRSIRYDEIITPIDSIQTEVDKLGVMNIHPDSDDTVRRQPSIVAVDDQYALSFSLAAYLAYLQIPTLAVPDVISQDGNVLNLPAERQLAIDDRGFWLHNYFGAPATESRETFPVVSLVDVLNGTFNPDLFRDKVVLVGLFAAGDRTDQLAERYPVPVSQEMTMTGVEIQANAIETLINDAVISIVPDFWQGIIIIGLALVSGSLAVYAHRLQKLGVVLLLALVTGIIAFIVFSIKQMMLPLFYPALAIVIPYLLFIGRDILHEYQQEPN